MQDLARCFDRESKQSQHSVLHVYMNVCEHSHNYTVDTQRIIRHILSGGAPQGGRGAAAPPNLSIGGASPPQLEHWGGGIAPPTLGYNTKGCLRVHYCRYSVTVYTGIKPHDNVISRPPNLAVLPPPLFIPGLTGSYAVINTWSHRIMSDMP